MVIREADPGDRFYVVAEGRFAVDVGGLPRPQVTAGGAFGETALLQKIPRTATVRALQPGMLVGVDRDSFLTVVTGHPRTSQLANAVADSYAVRPAAGDPCGPDVPGGDSQP